MPKHTTAKRLAHAIEILKTRVEEYIKKIAASDMRNGFCVVVPTHTGSPPWTNEQMEAVKVSILEKFKDEKLFGLAIQYISPPAGLLRSSKPEGYSDYEIRAGIVEFDEGWQIDQFAKGLLYCPSEKELGTWHSRYEKHSEGLRLTPLVDMALRDMRAREVVIEFLNCRAEEFFISFVKDHVKIDRNIKKAHRSQDIRVLYHEIPQFPAEGAPIFHAYAQARGIKSKTRNPKIKDLMCAFLKHVDKHCMRFASQVGASSITIDEILRSLQQDFPKTKTPYEAERSAEGLHYLWVAKILMSFILEFLESPQKYSASGEIAMFVWLCQHLSFRRSLHGVKISDLLNLKTEDVNILKKSMQIKEEEIPLTGGLTEVFAAWIGEGKRVNARKFFTELNYDLLADNLKRVAMNLQGFDRDLLPKDLLVTPHVMGHDAVVHKDTRDHLDWQRDFVSTSPYANTSDLSKRIREEIVATISKSMR